MIYTGYYAKVDEYKEEGLTPIAISMGSPIWYEGLHWRPLAPSYDIFSKWKNKEINEFTFTSRYISEVLNKLNKEELKREIMNIENPIFLCYKKEGFCHRHILADWLEMNLGLVVEEYKC